MCVQVFTLSVQAVKIRVVSAFYETPWKWKTGARRSARSAADAPCKRTGCRVTLWSAGAIQDDSCTHADSNVMSKPVKNAGSFRLNNMGPMPFRACQSRVGQRTHDNSAVPVGGKASRPVASPIPIRLYCRLYTARIRYATLAASTYSLSFLV